jgi:lipopolysaccharide/colanic/teichoic acid biosynthesis glycosyltransferase
VKSSFYHRYGKRAFDVAVSASAMVVGAPIIAAVAMAVRHKLGRPVLFTQQRPGLGGAPFTIFKFRTMTDARDADGRLLPDAERLPAFGRWLRKTSLDELPELYNVLRGDMSLVGPRPLLMQYLELYSPWQMRRHDVRPGITGLAQVRGRNDQTWQERFEHDVEYVGGLSLGLDLRILAETVVKAILQRGISAPGSATMEPFTGNHEDNPSAPGKTGT